jgi:hypothetical protein
MKKHSFLSVAIVVGLLAIMSRYSSGEDFVEGIARLSGQLADGTPVKIEVRTMKLNAQFPYKDASMWGSAAVDESKVVMPKTAIRAIDVRVGDDKLFVPLSAYCDLGDPSQISFEKAECGFKLILMGGRYTPSGYKAELLFDSEHIQRRKVALRVFPDDVWDLTVYSYISKYDQR